VFQVVKAVAPCSHCPGAISQIGDSCHQVVRYSWSQHVEAAQVLGAAGPADQGVALALMGAALLMLAQDLLLDDSPISVCCD